MKTLITTILLASTFTTGAAFADYVSPDQSDTGIAFETNSHYSSKELVTIDGSNLPEYDFNTVELNK